MAQSWHSAFPGNMLWIRRNRKPACREYTILSGRITNLINFLVAKLFVGLQELLLAPMRRILPLTS